MSGFITTLRLPGVVQVAGDFSPPGYGDVPSPEDDVYLDLGVDFPPEVGPNVPIPIGDGTIYQLPISPMGGAVGRAWTLHGWQTLQLTGTIRIASQMFVGAAGSVSAVYRANPGPGPAGPPVGGIAEFNIGPVSFPSTPLSIATIGQQKWSQFHDQTAPGRSVFYDATWPGINRSGNIETAASIAGFDLDWKLPIDRLGAPTTPPPTAPASYGTEIYREAVGDYDFYLGSDVSGWDGSPASRPTPTSVGFDFVIRAQAYGNTALVRRKDLSGVYQYPVVLGYILSASIEQDSVSPSAGYFGSPPIAPDTNGFQATESGLLKVCSILNPGGTFAASGVGVRLDIPGGSFIGDVSSHNYSESFAPDPAAGDNGWSANSIPWQSDAIDFIVHFQSGVFWGDAPPL